MSKRVYTPAMPTTWIKADSGEVYICPIDKISGLNNPTEDDLRKLCVAESENPQNN